MPTYTYKREDGSIFEFDQRITEDAIEVCPTTGQKVKRVISGGAGLVFKGSGFYLTDYGKSGSSGSDSKKAESNSEKKSESKENKSSDASKKTEKASTAPAKDD